MKLKEKTVRYTTEAALAWAMKKLESVSFKKKDAKLLKMNGKKIKIVIKIYTEEDDE